MEKKKETAKEKIEHLKEKMPKRIRQALLTTAIVGAGAASVVGISSYVKKEREKENNRVNTEWKKEFADADSVYADSRTAHFYAHKDLKNKDKAQLEDYLQKLKNEKGNQKAELLQFELHYKEGSLERAEKLFNEGTKVDRYLMERASEDPSYIQTGDSYEMMKRLFEQYEKYGGYDDVMKEDFSGYDWSNIRKNLQKYIAQSGDERYQEFVDFASKEIRKAKEEGHYWDGKKYDKTFDIGFYASRHFKLHPLSQAEYLSVFDKIEVLDVEIEKTEFQLESGREYEIEMTSKDSKKILSASKGIQQAYIEALKLKGNVKD